MTKRIHALAPAILVVSLVVLACGLPQRLLGSTDLEDADLLQQPTEPSIPGEGGGENDPGSATGGLGDLKTSPAYNIYVGANVTGNCGGYTNSGGFAALTFDSVFHSIRFSPPSEDGLMGPFGGIYKEGGEGIPIIGMGLLGTGELGDFTFCPMYEPEAHACAVTEGPSPFEPTLALYPSDADIPVVPLVGTPMASSQGEALLLYSIGAASDLRPIMTWDCEIGTGALGGSVNPVEAAFSIPWESLMLGEEFSAGAIGGDEGETWQWTIRFVPAQ